MDLLIAFIVGMVCLGLLIDYTQKYYKKFIKPRKIGAEGEKRLKNLLELYEFESAHNIYIPDSDGELAQIDHLVKFQNSIAVIETKNYSGRIDGVEYDRNWVQSFGNYMGNIPNPIYQMKRQAKHLSQMLPDVRVWGGVVYVGEATFPNGTPDSVFTFEEFRNYLANYKTRKKLHEHSREIEAAWLEVLEQATQTTKDQKLKHLLQMRLKHGRNKDHMWHLIRLAIFVSGIIGTAVYMATN